MPSTDPLLQDAYDWYLSDNPIDLDSDTDTVSNLQELCDGTLY